MSKPISVLACIAVMLVAVLGSSVSAATSKVAPADEYFGRQKLSILGIGNMIKDMRLRVEADMTRSGSIYGALANVEDAMHDWETKYPADTWVPKDLELLEAVYFEVPEQRARDNGTRIEVWLVRDYPQSQYAVTGRAVMASAHPLPAAVPVVGGVAAAAVPALPPDPGSH
jgi:hypothetical protein